MLPVFRRVLPEGCTYKGHPRAQPVHPVSGFAKMTGVLLGSPREGPGGKSDFDTGWELCADPLG